MNRYQWTGKNNLTTGEGNFYIWCSICRKRPKVVGNYNIAPFLWQVCQVLVAFHWLWVCISLQSERQEEAFLAYDEWCGSCRCFCVSGWVRTTPRFSKNNDDGLRALLSKMPKKGPKMPKHRKHLIRPPYHHVKLCLIKNSSESILWLIYGSENIWTPSHTENQLSMGGSLTMACLSLCGSTVIKCHRTCSTKMTNLPVMTMTLMMKVCHLPRMRAIKIEWLYLPHAVNAPT